MSVELNLANDVPSLPIFQGVEAGVLCELLASAHPVQFQKAALVVEQGDPISRYYVMLEGWCGATKGNAEGQEAVLQLFRRGDILFDLTQDINVGRCTTNIEALTQVNLLALTPSAVYAAKTKSQTLTENILKAFGRRVLELRDHIEQLTLHTAEERVGRFLLQLRLNADAESKDIVLPFDKSVMAAYLGIKPETLSRVFQVFRERGFTVARSHLVMPARDALCLYCDKVTMRACPFANLDGCSFSMSKLMGKCV